MLITSWCDFSVFCMGVLYHLLSVFSGWLTARASHCSLAWLILCCQECWSKSCILVLQHSVKCSEDFFFSVISYFASLLLPIWETRGEYFPSGWAFLPRHPAEVTPWPHQGHDFAWLTAIAGQTQSCTSANLLQWQKFLSALASLTKPE